LGGGINSLGTTIGPLVVALALFGTASVSEEDIHSLGLDKVILLYICVGLLFVGIAALFGFSKKLPSGKNEEKTEGASKALRSLLIITGLLIVCFAPVFSSYKSEEAFQILNKEEQIKKLETLISNSNTIAILENDIIKLREPLEQERMVWLSLGLAVVVIGLLFSLSRSKKKPNGWGAMQYPQLILGMLAIFIYVGVEVAVGSNLGEYLKHQMNLNASQIAPYAALYWGSLMIGRWASAIHAFELKEKTKHILTILVPFIAFGVVLGLTSLAGHDVSNLYAYIVCVVIQIVGFYFGKNKPARTLMIFSLLGLIATVIGFTTNGIVSVYALLSVGLFCSIMWPCIFSLSLGGLGKYQAQGSAFLIMMILGGAIIPPLQGKLSDIIGIQPSFIIGSICFIYLTVFAFIVKRMLNKQGLNFE
jgi:FHS family L-fucose permease-like MFS transporter